MEGKDRKKGVRDLDRSRLRWRTILSIPATGKEEPNCPAHQREPCDQNKAREKKARARAVLLSQLD